MIQNQDESIDPEVQSSLQRIRSKHRIGLDHPDQNRFQSVRSPSSSPKKSLHKQPVTVRSSSAVHTVRKRGRPRGCTKQSKAPIAERNSKLESLVKKTLQNIKRWTNKELGQSSSASADADSKPLHNQYSAPPSTIDSPTEVSGSAIKVSDVPVLRPRATITSPRRKSINPVQTSRRSIPTTISSFPRKNIKKNASSFLPEPNGKVPATEERTSLVQIEHEAIMEKAGPGFRLFVRCFTDELFASCVYNPLLNTTGRCAPTNLRYICILRNAWKSLSETNRQEWHKIFSRLSAKNLVNSLFEGKIRLDLSLENIEFTAQQKSDRRWLDSFDPDRLPCPLCSRTNPRRYTTTGLLSHISLSHPAVRLYTCHFCLRGFSTVTALRSHAKECPEFAKYLKKCAADSNSLIFDFAYLALICADCGLQIALSPQCNDETFASDYFKTLLCHSTQNFTLLMAFSCMELPDNSVHITFLRSAFFSALLNCQECDFRAKDCVDLERHCASEHREELLRRCPLKCNSPFFTDAAFCDHMLTDHMPDQPLVCQFLQSVALGPAALDKSVCVRVGADPPRVCQTPASPSSESEKSVRKSVRKRKPLSAMFGGEWCVNWEGAEAESSKHDDGDSDSRDGSPAAASSSRSPQPSGANKKTFAEWQESLADALKSPTKRGSKDTTSPLHAECIIQVGYRGGPVIVRNTLDGALLTTDLFQCEMCSTILSNESVAQAHLSGCPKSKQHLKPLPLVKIFDAAVQLPFARIRCAKCPTDHCSIQALRRHCAQEHGDICRYWKDSSQTIERCAEAVQRKEWLETAFDRELATEIARYSVPPVQCKSEVESAILDSPDYFPLLSDFSANAANDSLSSALTDSPNYSSSMSLRVCKTEPIEAEDDCSAVVKKNTPELISYESDLNPARKRKSSANSDPFSMEDQVAELSPVIPPKKRHLSPLKKLSLRATNDWDTALPKSPRKTPDSGVSSLSPKEPTGDSGLQRALRPRTSGRKLSKKIAMDFEPRGKDAGRKPTKSPKGAAADSSTVSHQKAGKRLSSAEQSTTRKTANVYRCFLCPTILASAELWEKHLADHSDFSLEDFEASEEFCIVDGGQQKPTPTEEEEDEETRAANILISTYNSSNERAGSSRDFKGEKQLVGSEECAAAKLKEKGEDDDFLANKREAMLSDEAIVRNVVVALVDKVCRDVDRTSTSFLPDTEANEDDVTVLSANCVECHLQFVSLEEAINHQKVYHTTLLFPLPKNQSTFLCRACCVAFPDHAAYFAHTETHRQMLIACKRCSLVASGRDHFIEHRRFHTLRRQFACFACKVYYTDELKLVYHLAKFHKKCLAYFCKLCGLCSTDLRIIEKHIFDEPCSEKMNMDYIGVCDAAQLRFTPISEEWYNRQVGLGTLESVSTVKCRHLCLSAPEPSETMVTCKDCICPIPLSAWNAMFRRLDPDSPLKEEGFLLAADDRTFRTTAEVFFALTAYHDGPGPVKMPQMPIMTNASWSDNEEAIKQYVNAVKTAVCRQMNKEKDEKQRMLLVKKLQRQKKFNQPPPPPSASPPPSSTFLSLLKKNQVDNEPKLVSSSTLLTDSPAPELPHQLKQPLQPLVAMRKPHPPPIQRPSPQILTSSRRMLPAQRLIPVPMEGTAADGKDFVLPSTPITSNLTHYHPAYGTHSSYKAAQKMIQSIAPQPMQRGIVHHRPQHMPHNRQMPAHPYQGSWQRALNIQRLKGSSMQSNGGISMRQKEALTAHPLVSTSSARSVGPSSNYYSTRPPGNNTQFIMQLSTPAPPISMVRVVKEGPQGQQQQQPILVKTVPAASSAPNTGHINLPEQKHHQNSSPNIENQHRFVRVIPQ